VREARGLSQTAVARMVELTSQSISLYERGETVPGPAVVERLSDKLGVPYGFFFSETLSGQSGPLFYRSLSAATKTARLSCERQYEWLVEIVQYLTRFVRLPAYDVPELAMPGTARAITAAMIEDAASACRRAWGLGDGPISNVVWLLENHGVVLSRFPFGAESLDAFSRWNDAIGRGVIMLNSDKSSAARSRFDAAHELGHLILHRGLPEAESPDSATWKLLEGQAHRFSSAFLLPEAAFRSEVAASRSFDHFIRLKEKWRCSIQMMLRRARDIGVLTDAEYAGMMIGMGRKGWRSREPLDDRLDAERPALLRSCFKLLAERGVRTVGTMRQEIVLSVADVSELAGLEQGFLSEPPPTGEIIEVIPNAVASLVPGSNPPAKILPFRIRSAQREEADEGEA
jgi:Zn-dependent peptidase ImmA (M78 family)/DNA-binding XRE family transcriptional regulator